MAKAPGVPFDLKTSMLAAFVTNNRINQYLLENIPAEAWAAKPPEGKGRPIAAIAAHIHNVRLMWLKAAGVGKLPAKLDERVSVQEACRALAESHDALATLLLSALDTGEVKNFKPDAASFYTYLIAHDAHHRGQIISLARRLGHPVSQGVGFGMWDWGVRGKEMET